MTLTTGELLSPRGHPVKVVARPDTTDFPTLCSTLHPAGGEPSDEYGIGAYELSGWAVDVGAHIGSVTLGLLADNPDLRVIAVEPLPGNVEILRANLEANGWSDRCIVLAGGIGADATVDVAWGAPANPDSYRWQHRFIGNITGGEDHPIIETATAYGFAQIVDMAGGEIALAKWDCEGCEWIGLTERQEACRIIVGEWHRGDMEALRGFLSPTHDVEIADAGGIGAFRAVLR